MESGALTHAEFQSIVFILVCFASRSKSGSQWISMA